MKVSWLACALAAPLLVSAQSLTTSITVITSEGFNGQHSPTTVITTSTSIFTVTAAPQTPTNSAANPSGGGNSASNPSGGGNSAANPSGGGNSVNASNNSSAAPTKASPLPTAVATAVDGGGNGPKGAPTPGMSGNGNNYGPPDDYISGAAALARAGAGAVIAGVTAGALLLA